MQAPLVAKPTATRRKALAVVVIVAVAGFAGFAATSARLAPLLAQADGANAPIVNEHLSPISAVASTSTCDTPLPGQTCGEVAGKSGHPSGFVAGHAFTPCYCSPTQGVKKIKVKVVGCLGKCDVEKQCPHALRDYLYDVPYGIPNQYPYPHFSILSDSVEVDVAEFKKVISAAAHKACDKGGSACNWWKPNFTHTLFHPHTPSIELQDSNSGPSTTLKDLCDAIKEYTPLISGLPKITKCDGMETSAGTHITVPNAWVSNGDLGQSHKDYLRGETHGHKIPVLGVDLTWWVTILYSDDGMDCFEKYPYHLASA